MITRIKAIENLNKHIGDELFESAEKAFDSVKKGSKNSICLFSDSMTLGQCEKQKTYMPGYTTFEKDREATLFYSYIEQIKYIEYLEGILKSLNPH